MTPDQLRVVGELRVLAASGKARTLRVDRRIGLRELARSIKASPSAVSRWEHGLHSPRDSVALRWATALGLTERATEIGAATEKRAAGPGYQPGPAAENDRTAGYQPAAPAEQTASPIAR